MKQFVMGFGQFVNEMLEPTCECGGALMEDGTCSECGAQQDLTAAAPEFDQPAEFPEISEAKKKPGENPFAKKDSPKPGEKSKTFPFAKVKGKEEKEPAKTGKKLSKSEQARKNFGLDKKK